MRIGLPRLRLLLAASCLVAAGLSCEATYAETRTAAALTPEAVREAIDAAKDGDTVQLPGGTAVWSKGWNTGHGAKMKAITIRGAGIDKTTIEDNEVYIAESAGANGKRSGNNPWIAPNNCARIVIRHNKIVNAELEIYAPGRNGQYGCQQCEIYDNQFSLDDHTTQIIIEIAAGVGMVFNNTVTGTSYSPRVIGLKNHRTFYVMRGSPFGKADGTNPIDGNEIPAGQVGAGYPCMGQPGRATNLSGGRIFDSTPCYAWNNTLNGEKLLMAVSMNKDPNQLAQIKEGREFFNEKPPEEYYKPYIYPHPLQSGWDVRMKSAAGPAEAGSGRRSDNRP